MQVDRVADSISQVRCASGNVSELGLVFCYNIPQSNSKIGFVKIQIEAWFCKIQTVGWLVLAELVGHELDPAALLHLNFDQLSDSGRSSCTLPLNSHVKSYPKLRLWTKIFQKSHLKESITTLVFMNICAHILRGKSKGTNISKVVERCSVTQD